MGIVNLTPDSFSDGGRFQSLSDVLRTVEQMIKDGVDILDLGAESTRPGSARIDENTELSRLMPVLEAIKKNFDICISIDTYKPMVMKAALNSGADWINDVLALENEASI